MGKNKHIAEITVIWPDDKWDENVEREYLINCVAQVLADLTSRSLPPSDTTIPFFNRYGRTYAELLISRCKPLSGEEDDVTLSHQ